jgi:hypothetical protein
MNQSEQDLILKNLQTLLKLQAEEIYNLEEDIKKIKKENNLI